MLNTRQIFTQNCECYRDINFSNPINGFQKALKLWLHDPATRDAIIVRSALTAPVVDNQAITEIICSRTPSQLRRMKELYLSTYHSPIEHDIENQTSGDHKKVLKMKAI